MDWSYIFLLRLKGNILKVNPERRSSLILPRQNSVFKRAKSRLYLKKNSDKKGSNIQPLEYDNSYTRLFIGETDEVSVRERYLSNMVTKTISFIKFIWGLFLFVFEKNI